MMETPTILRPAQLDAKDTAIVLAVARRWADGLSGTFRDVMVDTGCSNCGLRYRILGACSKDNHRRRVGGGLIENGWIDQEQWINRTLRPGPRFGGIQRSAGIVYERVAWEE